MHESKGAESPHSLHQNLASRITANLSLLTLSRSSNTQSGVMSSFTLGGPVSRLFDIESIMRSGLLSILTGIRLVSLLCCSRSVRRGSSVRRAGMLPMAERDMACIQARKCCVRASGDISFRTLCASFALMGLYTGKLIVR